jgi:hypothetical protein
MACVRVYLRKLRLLGHMECRISKAQLHKVFVLAILVFVIPFCEKFEMNISREMSNSLATCV